MKRDGVPTPIQYLKQRQEDFYKKIANIPVIRVLFSGVAAVSKVKSGVVKRGAMHDICLVLDEKEDLEPLLDIELTREVKRMRPAPAGANTLVEYDD